ncbi:MAG: hypothetical protein HQK58_11025 [Deltaproteobacteria bacterium]|nr:hypothetical protein [Deltaproteobacteria bacterium]
MNQEVRIQEVEQTEVESIDMEATHSVKVLLSILGLVNEKLQNDGCLDCLVIEALGHTARLNGLFQRLIDICTKLSEPCSPNEDAFGQAAAQGVN